ncbi:hypothetical protein EAI_04128 [Harpegnathos saltator]|uniref:Uncharacterized protein n=1 Tax=Harpegnathos saltator TaxID=610380 RepID=E2C5P7_HARSA|nr:hypothetical protein EAI_04128 [Harpegnathos saltator]
MTACAEQSLSQSESVTHAPMITRRTAPILRPIRVCHACADSRYAHSTESSTTHISILPFIEAKLSDGGGITRCEQMFLIFGKIEFLPVGKEEIHHGYPDPRGRVRVMPDSYQLKPPQVALRRDWLRDPGATYREYR